MTHRGPFQPLTFCDSVLTLQKRGLGVARLGSGSAEGAVSLEHHEPCRSQQQQDSRRMACPSRDGIILFWSAITRTWPDTVSGFGPPSVQDMDKLM